MDWKRFTDSKRFRWVASLLVMLHLLAMTLPPMAFQTRGPMGVSPSVSTLLRPVEAYGQFLYLNRGYAFFAPDPGPSHLIQVAISDESGNREELLYPDRRRQWPRLLYHRHFMLTEFLNEIYQPPLPETGLAEFDPAEIEEWRKARLRYERFRQSLLDHLGTAFPDRDVALRRVEHLLPDLARFQESPLSLTDENSYRVLLDQPVEVPVAPDRLDGANGAEQLPAAAPLDANGGSINVNEANADAGREAGNQ